VPDRLHHAEQLPADTHGPEVRGGLGSDALLERALIEHGHAVGGAVDPEHRIAVQEPAGATCERERAGAVAHAAARSSRVRAAPTHVRAEPLLAQQPADRHGGDQAPAGRVEVHGGLRDLLLDDEAGQSSRRSRVEFAVEVHGPVPGAALRRPGMDLHGRNREVSCTRGRGCPRRRPGRQQADQQRRGGLNPRLSAARKLLCTANV
jgi:hypothetical protein